MRSYVAKLLDEGEPYPRKALVLSVYNRFDELDEHLSGKPGGVALEVCCDYKMEAAKLGLRLKGDPDGLDDLVPDRTIPRHKRFLLKKPCTDAGIDYDALFNDFFALEEASHCHAPPPRGAGSM